MAINFLSTMSKDGSQVVDAEEVVKNLIGKGNDILILGNFNEDIADVNSGMAKILAKFKMHDLLRHAVGTNSFATYAREINSNSHSSTTVTTTTTTTTTETVVISSYCYFCRRNKIVKVE